MSTLVQTINSVQRESDYAYDLLNNITSIVYPYASGTQGNTVTLSYNTAGRLSTVSHSSFNYETYPASGAEYLPGGQLAGARVDASDITITNSYNSRLQPISLQASTSANTLMSRTYDFHAGSADNGNVWAVTDGLDAMNISGRPTGSANFSYDSLNRLTGASTTGTDCTVMSGGATKNYGNSYTLDPWGNFITNSVTKCSSEAFSYTAQWNNQLSGITYDPLGSGDVTNDGHHSYTYDAENRISKVDGGATAYTYNGDGDRVEKNGSRLYWLSPTGLTLAETDASGNLQAQYVYFGAQRVARIDQPSGAVSFYINDHLGSATVITNANGVETREEMYYPFGGERWSTGSDSNHFKFTSKERDSESGNEYFGARYYGSGMGRFQSPDWSLQPQTVPFANFENPATLNLYSCAGNNPVARTDPDGHFWEELKNCFKWSHCVKDSQLEAALQAQADRDRQTIANMKNLSINGKAPADAIKGLNNKQIVGLQRYVLEFLNQQVMSRPSTMVALAIAGQGAEGLEGLTSAAIAEGRASAWIVNTGKSALASDITTNLTTGQFGANLEASGYARSVAKDGVTTLYSKGNEVYSIYPRASSTGGPTANLNIGGQIVTKIRLQQ